MGANNEFKTESGQKLGRKAWEVQGNSGEVPGASQTAAGRFVSPCPKWIFHVSPHGPGSVTRADVNYIFSSYFPTKFEPMASDFQLGGTQKERFIFLKKYFEHNERRRRRPSSGTQHDFHFPI